MVLLMLSAVAAFLIPSVADADLADEQALGERFAPVVRLVEQTEECGPGEPYQPTDVDVLFDEPTVALRGPWNPTDLVKIGPSAEDLVRPPYDYHLDFPGNALDPGCDYQRWARRLTTGSAPAVYAHVATDPGYPEQLALQYWLFYPFNVFNNSARGRLGDHPARLRRPRCARGARRANRSRSVTAQHEGAERAEWGTTSSRSSEAPIRSCIRRPARTRTSSTEGSVPRQLGGSRCRLRRHAWSACRVRSGRQDDPERPVHGTASVPLDRLRRPLG